MTVLRDKINFNTTLEKGNDNINRDGVLEGAGIYIIECLRNGKVYVGRSKNMKYRITSHERELRRGTHINPHLQHAYNKYGPEAFLARTLEVLPVDDWQLQQIRESHWAGQYDVFNNGFNIVPIIVGDVATEFSQNRAGENSWHSKLSIDDIWDICELLNEGERSLTDIGRMFNTTISNIRSIRDGKSWTDVTKNYLKASGRASNKIRHNRLSEHEIIGICELLNDGELTLTDIAARYNASVCTVQNILVGKLHTKIVNEHLTTNYSQHRSKMRRIQSEAAKKKRQELLMQKYS